MNEQRPHTRLQQAGPGDVAGAGLCFTNGRHRFRLEENRDEGGWQGDPEMASDYCSSCGDQLVDGKRYCPNCGARRAEDAVPPGITWAGAPTEDDAPTTPWYLLCPECDMLWILDEREVREQTYACEDCGRIIPVANGSPMPPGAAFTESRPTPWYVVCPSCDRVWELGENEAQAPTYVCEECGWSMAVAEGTSLEPATDPSSGDESERGALAPPPPMDWSSPSQDDRRLSRTLLVVVAIFMLLLIVAFLLSQDRLGL